jgi:hypothetical protein
MPAELPQQTSLSRAAGFATASDDPRRARTAVTVILIGQTASGQIRQRAQQREPRWLIALCPASDGRIRCHRCADVEARRLLFVRDHSYPLIENRDPNRPRRHPAPKKTTKPPRAGLRLRSQRFPVIRSGPDEQLSEVAGIGRVALEPGVSAEALGAAADPDHDRNLAALAQVPCAPHQRSLEAGRP